MSDDDSQLFRKKMRGVKPLKSARRADLKPSGDVQKKLLARKRAVQSLPEHIINPLTLVDYIDAVKPHETLSFKRDGVQHSLFKSLRLGKLPVEANLDLHGLTVEEAREQVPSFLQACAEEGIRVAIITHGHGEFRERPALLKSCVNQWLRELNNTLAFHTAQPKHGGSGASYVLVRRNKQ